MSSINPEWVGYAGAFFTCSCFVPQVVKVFREKHTKSISLGMYVMNAIAIVIWSVYAVMIDSPSILLTNAIAMGMVATIITMKLKYG